MTTNTPGDDLPYTADELRSELLDPLRDGVEFRIAAFEQRHGGDEVFCAGCFCVLDLDAVEWGVISRNSPAGGVDLLCRDCFEARRSGGFMREGERDDPRFRL
jgi:hypothetical protein